jgi:hypothetical protein
MLTAAWYAAAFHRAKKLPELATVLTRARRVGAQTRTEQDTMLHRLSGELGVPLRRVRFVRKAAA